jgi:hypothetical protein
MFKKLFEKYGLKPIGNFILIGLTISLSLHQFIQKTIKIQLPVLDNYLDMLVFGFYLPFLYRVEKTYKSKLPHSLELTRMELLGIAILGLFFSEFIFPMISHKFTADPWDALPYLLGMLLYSIGQKSFFNRNLS